MKLFAVVAVVIAEAGEAELFLKRKPDLVQVGEMGGLNKAVVHEDITAIDLCRLDTADPCSATGRVLNFPAVTSIPTYSWNVTAALPSDVTAPTYEVRVAVDELPGKRFDYNLTWGRGSGSACGEVQVPFGLGKKGDKWEAMPCPGCHVVLRFPACTSLTAGAETGWKKGSPMLVEGEFKAGFFYFEVLTVPNITVDVTVRSKQGRVIALRSLAHPKRLRPNKSAGAELADDRNRIPYALVPNEACPTKKWFGNPVPCFEMVSEAQLKLAHAVDPYQPCPRKEADIRQGTCASFGWTTRWRADPVIRSMTWWTNPNRSAEEVEALSPMIV